MALEINKLCKRSDGEFCCDQKLYTCNLSGWPFTTGSAYYYYYYWTTMPSGNAKPLSTVTTGSWSYTGSSFIGALAKDAVNDTTYIIATANTTCEVALANPVLPGDNTVYFRYRKSASGGNTRGITASLYRGATLVAEKVVASISETWTDDSFTATPSGGDYGDLRIRLESTGSTGGSGSVRRDVHVSLARYQTTRPGRFACIADNWAHGAYPRDPAHAFWLGTTAEINAWWPQFDLNESRWLLTIPSGKEENPFSLGPEMYPGYGWSSAFGTWVQINHGEVMCVRCVGDAPLMSYAYPNGNLREHNVATLFHPCYENNQQVWVRSVMRHHPNGGVNMSSETPFHQHRTPPVGSTTHTYGPPATWGDEVPLNSYFSGLWTGTALLYPAWGNGFLNENEYECWKDNPPSGADAISVDWTQKFGFYHTQGTLNGSPSLPYVANPDGRYCCFMEFFCKGVAGTIELWFENEHKTRLNCLDRIRTG